MKSKYIKYIFEKIYEIRLNFFIKVYPKYIANRSYKGVFKRNINWKNPTDLIEKIYWLQFNTDTSLWTICADKYLVRDYVEEKGLGFLLNDLYGEWDSPDDIEWDLLPNSFVLKTNNGCGQVIIVKDKNNLNIPEATKTIKNWLNEGYGQEGAQLHYSKIKPRIIAEKFLINETNPDNSLVDYKIWCFHGIPECILVVFDRKNGMHSLSAYDLNWQNISEVFLNKNSKYYSGKDIPKPESLQEMIKSATKLSEYFPQVRIDFYNIDGRAVFGEMTFTTGFGSYSEKYYKYLGSKIDLEKVQRIEKK